MPTLYVPDGIRVAELFDGRLAAYGIEKIIDDEVDCRYLVNERASIQVYGNDRGYVMFFVAELGDPQPLLAAIGEAFGTKITEKRERTEDDEEQNEFAPSRLREGSAVAIRCAELVAARLIGRVARSLENTHRFIPLCLPVENVMHFDGPTLGIQLL